MTVYNAHQFVAETLESLLTQDYSRLEICISDNASTDGSSEVCQHYAARDARIRYARNEENLGAVRNWNRALELSSGQYYMWASDHDLWDASYISRAVEVLARISHHVSESLRFGGIEQWGGKLACGRGTRQRFLGGRSAVASS